MADETETALAKAVDQALATDAGGEERPQAQAAAAVATPFPRRPLSLRPANTGGDGELSVLDQFSRIEHIQQQLKDKLRREKLNLMHGYDRKVTEIRADYDRQINAQVTKLERARDAELRSLNDEYDQKMAQYDRVAAKIGM